MTWDGKLFNRHLSTRRFGRELRHFEEMDSTNSWLAANHGYFNMTGAVVVADHQTNGRGRQERSWLDIPERSLLFSMLIRIAANSDGAELISLLPAVALARALAAKSGEEVRVNVKWPNDVQLNGRKVAGILGQSSIVGGRRVLILGVGCNVSFLRVEMPAEFRELATSVQDETAAVLPREALLAEFLNQFEPLFDEWSEQQFASIITAWEAFGPARGTPLKRTEHGVETEGRYAGLGARGQLLLEDSAGRIHEVFSGDIVA